MGMKKQLKRLAQSFAAFLLCLVSLSTLASGYQRIDPQQKCSLSLTYVHGETPLEGMSVKLYRVASVRDYLFFELTGGFAASGVDLNSPDPSWPDLAVTLQGYVQANQEAVKGECVYSSQTDPNGNLTAEDLDTGLYLVLGTTLAVGNDRYTPNPFLLTLPKLEDDIWFYDVEEQVEQKLDYSHYTPSRSTLTVTVEKVWIGDEEATRPASVNVTLLKNGTEYETVTLDASHGWKHTWRSLSRKGEWTLTEQVPEGYTVLVEKNQGERKLTFTVTNTYSASPEPTPSQPPASPSQTPTDPPVLPSSDPSQPPASPQPSPVETPVTPPSLPPDPSVAPSPNLEPLASKMPEISPNDSFLPQTGLIWWPVCFFGGLGLLFLIFGLVILRKRERNG